MILFFPTKKEEAAVFCLDVFQNEDSILMDNPIKPL